jgi:hypothetical protein
MRWRAWAGALLEDDSAAQAPYQPVRFEPWLVAALVLFALVVRLLGIRMGLPFFHHWDEDYIAGSAKLMLANGNDVPSTYVYGAPLMRLTAMGYAVARALHLPVVALTDEVALRWISRVLSTVISTSGVVAAYLAGRWAFRRGTAALAAALLFAVAAELVWHARYGVTDASVAAFTMWTLAATAAYLRGRSVAAALLAVVAAGVTFAFKINGLLTALIPVGALALRAPLRLFGSMEIGEVKWRAALARTTLLGAVPAVFALFFFFNPHFLDRWSEALTSMTSVMDRYRLRGHLPPYHDRTPGLPHLAAALHYLAFQTLHTTWLLSGLLALVSVAGLVVGLARGNLLLLLGFLHAALLVVSIAFPYKAYLARMYLPAVPILCLGFGLGWDRIGSALRGRGLKIRPLIVAGAAVAALGAGPTYEAIQSARLGRDARAHALDLIAARARRQGPVTVAMTPSVAGAGAIGIHPNIGKELTRDGVRFLMEVSSPETASASGADYILIASFHVVVRHQTYREQWPFRSVPGYQPVAELPYNIYEHRLEIAPWWNGRVATLVLARSDLAGRPAPR